MSSSCKTSKVHYLLNDEYSCSKNVAMAATMSIDNTESDRLLSSASPSERAIGSCYNLYPIDNLIPRFLQRLSRHLPKSRRTEVKTGEREEEVMLQWRDGWLPQKKSPQQQQQQQDHPIPPPILTRCSSRTLARTVPARFLPRGKFRFRKVPGV